MLTANNQGVILKVKVIKSQKVEAMVAVSKLLCENFADITILLLKRYQKTLADNLNSLLNKLSSITEKYSLNNIYNVNEIGIFLCALLNERQV